MTALIALAVLFFSASSSFFCPLADARGAGDAQDRDLRRAPGRRDRSRARPARSFPHRPSSRGPAQVVAAVYVAAREKPPKAADPPLEPPAADGAAALN